MSIAVLDKAFSVLEVLARAGRGLTLAELREESRLPKPTIYRILLSLRNLGYVEQTEHRGSYRLSPRLGSLQTHGRDEALRVKARPLMERLQREFDETVNLGVLEGIFVRYVAVVETTQSLRWIVKPGARDAFHTTALGRAIVAGMLADEQARLIGKVLPGAASARRLEGRASLEAELAATAARGCAVEEEETATGVACVAVSLAWMNEPMAALSVSVPITRFPAERRAALTAAMIRIATGNVPFRLAK